MSHATVGTMLALESDCLRAERRKLVQAQESNRMWLKKALMEQVVALETEIDEAKQYEELARRREGVLMVQRQRSAEYLVVKKDARVLKEQQFLENRLAIDRRRQAEVEAMLCREQARDERIVQEQELRREEALQKAAHEDARRRAVSEEGRRLVEQRVRVVDERNRIDAEKAEALQVERKRIHDLRRRMIDEGKEVYESIKHEIHQQRVSCRYNTKLLRQHIEELTNSSLLNQELFDMSPESSVSGALQSYQALADSTAHLDRSEKNRPAGTYR
jgi:hypothetical protein